MYKEKIRVVFEKECQKLIIYEKIYRIFNWHNIVEDVKTSKDINISKPTNSVKNWER